MRLLDTVLGGQIPDVVLANQMDVLNQGFSNTGLSWSVAGVDRWIRPDWYIQSVGRYISVPQNTSVAAVTINQRFVLRAGIVHHTSR